uniref:Putative ovule protein n=1 Tax=Solanum chacoense TaxID=4108 RepID=A0A0V0IM38_SOLCH
MYINMYIGPFDVFLASEHLYFASAPYFPFFYLYIDVCRMYTAVYKPPFGLLGLENSISRLVWLSRHLFISL